MGLGNCIETLGKDTFVSLGDATYPSLKTFEFKKEVKHNAHQDNWDRNNKRFFGCLKYFKYGSSIKKNDHSNEDKCTY